MNREPQDSHTGNTRSDGPTPPAIAPQAGTQPPTIEEIAALQKQLDGEGKVAPHKPVLQEIDLSRFPDTILQPPACVCNGPEEIGACLKCKLDLIANRIYQDGWRGALKAMDQSAHRSMQRLKLHPSNKRRSIETLTALRMILHQALEDITVQALASEQETKRTWKKF